MPTTRRAPTTHWEEFLRTVGIDPRATVLVIGPPDDARSGLPAIPVLPGGHGMALLGGSAPLRIPDDAAATATGLPEACVDAAILLAAWPDAASMEDAAREAVRITRPGGRVVMGDVAADVLTGSMPSTYRAALLFRLFPEVGRIVRAAHAHDEMLGIELLRAGAYPVDVELVDVPMGFFDDADSYERAVRAGMWPGVTLLDDVSLDLLVAELRRLLRETRFPVIDRQPWVFAGGPKRP